MKYLFVFEDGHAKVTENFSDDDIQSCADGDLQVFRWDDANKGFEFADCEVEEIEPDEDDDEGETEYEYHVNWKPVR